YSVRAARRRTDARGILPAAPRAVAGVPAARPDQSSAGAGQLSRSTAALDARAPGCGVPKLLRAGSRTTSHLRVVWLPPFLRRAVALARHAHTRRLDIVEHQPRPAC